MGTPILVQKLPSWSAKSNFLSKKISGIAPKSNFRPKYSPIGTPILAQKLAPWSAKSQFFCKKYQKSAIFWPESQLLSKNCPTSANVCPKTVRNRQMLVQKSKFWSKSFQQSLNSSQKKLLPVLSRRKAKGPTVVAKRFK